MDYKKATLMQLADYVQTSPASRITQQLIYYRDKGDEAMVLKIKAARAEVKKRKLRKALDELE